MLGRAANWLSSLIPLLPEQDCWARQSYPDASPHQGCHRGSAPSLPLVPLSKVPLTVPGAPLRRQSHDAPRVKLPMQAAQLSNSMDHIVSGPNVLPSPLLASRRSAEVPRSVDRTSPSAKPLPRHVLPDMAAGVRDLSLFTASLQLGMDPARTARWANLGRQTQQVQQQQQQQSRQGQLQLARSSSGDGLQALAGVQPAYAQAQRASLDSPVQQQKQQRSSIQLVGKPLSTPHNSPRAGAVSGGTNSLPSPSGVLQLRPSLGMAGSSSSPHASSCSALWSHPSHTNSGSAGGLGGVFGSRHSQPSRPSTGGVGGVGGLSERLSSGDSSLLQQLYHQRTSGHSVPDAELQLSAGQQLFVQQLLQQQEQQPPQRHSLDALLSSTASPPAGPSPLLQGHSRQTGTAWSPLRVRSHGPAATWIGTSAPKGFAARASAFQMVSSPPPSLLGSSPPYASYARSGPVRGAAGTRASSLDLCAHPGARGGR